MAQRTAARTTDAGQQPDLVTGSLLDDFTRTAQNRQGSSISCNLTDKGAWYHDIGQGTELTILVFEEGIWITPEDN